VCAKAGVFDLTALHTRDCYFRPCHFTVRQLSQQHCCILSGGGLGVFFSAFIPFLGAVLILIFLAVYDVFAVYYGLVGKIAHSGLNKLQGSSYSFKDV